MKYKKMQYQKGETKKDKYKKWNPRKTEESWNKGKNEETGTIKKNIPMGKQESGIESLKRKSKNQETSCLSVYGISTQTAMLISYSKKNYFRTHKK